MSKEVKNKDKSDIEFNKIEDLSHLHQIVRDEKERLLDLKLDVQMGKEKNNQLIRTCKRKIARIFTRINQLEILKTLSLTDSKTLKEQV